MFFTFRAHHQYFFFFSIKASQCTQMDRKQMEHRYLIYCENFIVFLIYIPVLGEQVRDVLELISQSSNFSRITILRNGVFLENLFSKYIFFV